MTLDRTLCQTQAIDELLWKSGQNATGAETMWRLRSHPEFDFFLWQKCDYLYLSITVLLCAFIPHRLDAAVGSKQRHAHLSKHVQKIPFAVNVSKIVV